MTEHDLLSACEALVDALTPFYEGCDHDVGLCDCGVRGALVRGNAAIAKAKRGAEVTDREWKYRFVEMGGYDCMTDSFDIYYEIEEGGFTFYAPVATLDCGRGGRTPEQEADARLMAASKELLAACEAALKDVRELEAYTKVARPAAAKLEAAIAKAKL